MIYVHLKEIELENFKTFGGKTRVPFSQGYTAIIGPNGSGKSNILDAILFVLGPKSSKSLRAENLTDLIFNGGAKGKAASYCKVSLLFDNKDRSMPLDHDVVRLTRHVKLSGSSAGYSSSFYINGEKSSLKEFDSVLTSAGILSDGYNMVRQGLITSIIETGPIERRRILDRVSGIAPFDEQIEKAERERQEAEANIERLSIIMGELSEQLKGLRRDRESAMKYQELLQKKREAEALIAYRNRESVLTEINSIGNDIKGYEKSIEELKARRESLKEKKAAVEVSLSKTEEQIKKKGGDAAVELKKRLDSLRVEMARAKSVIENSEDNVAAIKRERKEIAADIKRLEKSRISGSKELEDAAAQTSILEKEISGLKKNIAEFEKKAGASDSNVRDIQKKGASLDKQIEILRKKEHELSLRKDRIADSKERTNQELADAEEKLSNLEFELKDINWSISELSKGLKSTKKDREKIQNLFYKKRNEEKELLTQQSELDAALKRLNREYSRLKAEEEAKQSAGGAFRAVDEILRARNEGKLRGIHGTVEELITLEEDFETPFQIAGANRLYAIVVDNDKRAAEAIDYLKKNKFGRATFLPLNKMDTGRPRGKAVLAAKKSLGFLMDHVDYDERYEAALWYVVGDTVVVSDLSSARELMGGIRIVTRDGQLIEASGAMIGGNIQKRTGKSPSLKGQIRKLNQDIERTSAALANVESGLLSVRSDLAELESKIRETGLGGENEVKLSAFERRKKEIESSVSATKKEMAKLKEFLNKLQVDGKEVEEELHSVIKELASLESEKIELQKAIAKVIDSDAGRKLQDMRSLLSEKLEEMSRLNTRKNTLENSLHLIMERILSLKKKDGELAERMKEAAKQMTVSEKAVESLSLEIRGLEKAESGLHGELSALQKKRDELYRKSVDIEGEIDSVTSKIETTGDFRRGLEVKLSVANEKLKEIEKSMEGLNVEVPQKLPSLSKLKRTVGECETNISMLGAVNMKALEDYDEKSERHAGIKEELGRLEAQKKKLLEVVEELEKKKKELFMKLYRDVNENLSEIYRIFSRGGKASLELENPENPFEGGLDIKASPSGKKVRLLKSLSGGEKSLAALAFIFALQQTNPSPFYILDEVDMFLDADNAGVVSRIIRENSQKAQFIQVTLRKVTLKQTEHIIGVMMQNSGVSEVVMKPNIDDFVEENRPMEVKT